MRKSSRMNAGLCRGESHSFFPREKVPRNSFPGHRKICSSVSNELIRCIQESQWFCSTLCSIWGHPIAIVIFSLLPRCPDFVRRKQFTWVQWKSQCYTTGGRALRNFRWWDLGHECQPCEWIGKYSICLQSWRRFASSRLVLGHLVNLLNALTWCFNLYIGSSYCQRGSSYRERRIAKGRNAVSQHCQGPLTYFSSKGVRQFPPKPLSRENYSPIEEPRLKSKCLKKLKRRVKGHQSHRYSLCLGFPYWSPDRGSEYQI